MMNKMWHIDSRNNSYTVTECDRARGSIHYIDKHKHVLQGKKQEAGYLLFELKKKESAKKVR